MAVWTLRGGRVLHVCCVPLVAALQHQLPFGFLLSASLLLPQELLSLQEDSGVDPTTTRVAVSGALVAGVPRVILGCLEDFARWVRLVPRVLRDGAGVFPGLPGGERKIHLLVFTLLVLHTNQLQVVFR